MDCGSFIGRSAVFAIARESARHRTQGSAVTREAILCFAAERLSGLPAGTSPQAVATVSTLPKLGNFFLYAARMSLPAVGSRTGDAEHAPASLTSLL